MHGIDHIQHWQCIKQHNPVGINIVIPLNPLNLWLYMHDTITNSDLWLVKKVHGEFKLWSKHKEIQTSSDLIGREQMKWL